MATYGGSVGDEYTPSNSFTPAPQKNGANFYGNWISSGYKWRLTSVDTTNKEAHWDMLDGTTVYQQYGFQIHWDSVNNKNVVRANDDNNTSDPHEFSVGQAQSSSDRHINIDTSDGDRLFGYGSTNANDDFDITWLFGTNGIPLWTTSSSSGGGSGSGPNPLSNNNNGTRRKSLNFW